MYQIAHLDPDFGQVRALVKAEKPSKAKMKVFDLNAFSEAKYTDLYCKRAFWAEGIHTSLEMDIAKIKQGWTEWTLGFDTVSIDESDIPLIKKLGSIQTFLKAYEIGKLESYYRAKQ